MEQEIEKQENQLESEKDFVFWDKHKKIWLAGIFILLIVGFGFFFWPKKSEKNGESDKNAEIVKIMDFSSWPEFKSEKYGFSFNYPNDWKTEEVKKEIDSSELIRIFWPNPDSRVPVFISFRRLNDVSSGKEFQSAISEKIGKSAIESRVSETESSGAISRVYFIPATNKSEFEAEADLLIECSFFKENKSQANICRTVAESLSLFSKTNKRYYAVFKQAFADGNKIVFKGEFVKKENGKFFLSGKTGEWKVNPGAPFLAFSFPKEICKNGRSDSLTAKELLLSLSGKSKCPNLFFDKTVFVEGEESGQTDFLAEIGKMD